MLESKISVLIPCYNAERYVAETLDCLLTQSCPPLEIIAVNDGSIDKTSAVLHRYIRSGVRVIDQKNAGAASARNRAFAASHGEYILFLDADDLICATHLEALAAVLPIGGLYIAMSQWDRFTTEPGQGLFPARPTYQNLAGPDWVAFDWNNGVPMTQSGMFLIPRKLLEYAGGWNEHLSLMDDFEFFSRIIPRSDGIRFAKQARLYYRSAVPGSLSGRNGRKAIESAYHSLMVGTQNLLDVKNTRTTRRAAANVLQNFVYGIYPGCPDLRTEITKRIFELGGSDLEPSGPPGFQKLRRWTGWRAARRIQLLAERLGLNQAGRLQHIAEEK